MKLKTEKVISTFGIAAIVAATIAPLSFVQKVEAANLNQAYVRLDRLAASTATGGTVCAKPSTASTEARVQVSFPTGFTVNSTLTNWTATTTNLPSGTTAWPGIGTATAVLGQMVTFPSTDLTVGTTYCFNFSGTNTLTTGTAGNDKTGTITTQDSVPATIDSSSFALSVISNDQIAVSAVVPPTFSFSLSGNTDTFTGNLTTAAGGISTSGQTATVSTNARNGWTAWVKSANAGLNSAGTGATIATAGSIDATPSDLNSTTGYLLHAATTGGAAVAAEYAGSATQGGTLSTNFQPIASASAPATADTVTLVERARVTATQAAANDYTDTLTIVAAGQF